MNQSPDENDKENIDDVEFESYNDDARGEIEEVDGEGLELSASEKIKQLKKKLKKCDLERKENLTGWQRSKADYVNLKKRSAETTEKQVSLAKQSVIESFFPIIDSFEAAMTGSSWDEASPSWQSGVESIFKQFEAALRSVGVEEISCLGAEFDPHLHTSIAVRETSDRSQDNKIAEVMQKGYIFTSGEVIRSPKVVVFHFSK